MAKRQIEIPVHNNSIVTSRSLNVNHPNNLNLYESSLEFQDLLREVKIRFDTNPKCYLREDYQKLIELLRLAGGESGNIKVEITGDGDAITDLNSNDGTLVAVKGETPNIAKVPKARWARNGVIDLENCNGIDYIIIPCTSKRQCLYVTNKYLGNFKHSETYESMASINPESTIEIDGNIATVNNIFLKTVSNWFDHVNSGKEYLYLPRVIDLTTLDINNLPSDIESEYFINCKEIVKYKKSSSQRSDSEDLTEELNNSSFIKSPLKILFHRSDCIYGYTQFPLLYSSRKSDWVSFPKERLNDTFVMKPFLIYRNPLNGLKGGVIPIKDGKVLIDQAHILTNTTLQLVSSGELIHFDNEGICSTQLNPNTYIYLSKKSCDKFKGNNNYISENDSSLHYRTYPRKRSSIVRNNIRILCGMMRRYKLKSKNVGGTVSTIKWGNLHPFAISKKWYTKKLQNVLWEYNELRHIYTALARIDQNNIRGAYKAFLPKCRSMLLRCYRGNYDRMNCYTVNKYSNILRIIYNLLQRQI